MFQHIVDRRYLCSTILLCSVFLSKGVNVKVSVFIVLLSIAPLNHGASNHRSSNFDGYPNASDRSTHSSAEQQMAKLRDQEIRIFCLILTLVILHDATQKQSDGLEQPENRPVRQPTTVFGVHNYTHPRLTRNPAKRVIFS